MGFKAEGGESRLRLAFIDGCSSKGQATNLHQADIAAVIATSRPIEDTDAASLSCRSGFPIIANGVYPLAEKVYNYGTGLLGIRS